MKLRGIGKKERILFQCICTALFLSFFWHCANPTAPTGGPKDSTPPVALKFKPENYQANFSSQTIEIAFDEYFVLDNANENIIISPMLYPKPTFRIKKKSLIIDFKECLLQENTTYNIWFGEAIKDLNERNTLDNFYYVFSTGEYVDSLEISGVIKDAFDLQPKAKAFVMLYTCENDTIPCDSLPYLVPPDYISQTLPNGSFTLKNLTDKPYRVFAVADANKNFMFDPGEEIAFLDSIIMPKAICRHDHSADTIFHSDSLFLKDSLIIDSLIVDSDIVPVDSLLVDTDMHHHPIPIELFMFTEVDSTLMLKESKVLDTTRIQCVFSRSAPEVSFSLWEAGVNNLPDSLPWKIEQWSHYMDSVTIWFPFFKNDSVKLFVNQNENVFDTLIFFLGQEEKKSAQQPRRRMQDRESDTIVLKTPRLGIKQNASGKFPFFSPLELSFGSPIYMWRLDNALFFIGTDSIPASFPELIVPDIFFQKAAFNYIFKENTSYRMVIPEGAFTDIYGYWNDSLNISFATDDSNIYGNLILDVTLPNNNESQIVLQLLTEKENLIKQFVISQSQKIDFGYLKPQKVKLKIIYDSIPNGKWDAGNYLHKIQPEQVLYYDKIIDIRANWFIEEEWMVP